MTPRSQRPSYPVADYEALPETPELRMVMLTLATGQEVPWHWHSQVADRFFCLKGPMVVETRVPREVFELEAGDSCLVPAKRATTSPARTARAASSPSSRASAPTISISSGDQRTAQVAMRHRP
jgi:hypothetical protein